MTYSIVARDKTTGHFGIAVASRFFAVGALVPHLAGGVGAVATQALVSPLYGPAALDLLREGGAPRTAVVSVVREDSGRQARQLHVIDHKGQVAAFTGDECIDWAGHIAGENVSVAGNMLTGPGVLDDTLSAYLEASGLPFVERLLIAMEAGEAAGGDKRGRQSAALKIVRSEDYPWLDIRADDHHDPLAELRRLYAVAQERYLLFADALPTKGNISGLEDRRKIDARIADAEQKRLAENRPSASFASPN